MRQLKYLLFLLWFSSDLFSSVIPNGLFISTDYLKQITNGKSRKFDDSIRILAVDIQNEKLSFDFMGGHEFISLTTKKTSKTSYEILPSSPFAIDSDKELKNCITNLITINKDSLKIEITDRASKKMVRQIFFVRKYKNLTFEQPIMSSINKILIAGYYLLSDNSSILDTIKVLETGKILESQFFKDFKFFNAYFQTDKKFPKEYYFIIILNSTNQKYEYAISTDFCDKKDIPLFEFSFVKKPNWLDINRSQTPKYILTKINGT